jgi:hypothetical protein
MWQFVPYSRGRETRDTSLRDQSSMGQFIHGTFHPGDASSKGRFIQGTHRPRTNGLGLIFLASFTSYKKRIYTFGYRRLYPKGLLCYQNVEFMSGLSLGRLPYMVFFVLFPDSETILLVVLILLLSSVYSFTWIYPFFPNKADCCLWHEIRKIYNKGRMLFSR